MFDSLTQSLESVLTRSSSLALACTGRFSCHTASLSSSTLSRPDDVIRKVENETLASDVCSKHQDRSGHQGTYPLPLSYSCLLWYSSQVYFATTSTTTTVPVTTKYY